MKSENCGIKNLILLIIFNALDELKWQVSIQWKYLKNTYHVCGASIIGKNWLLTAAHCTKDFDMKDLIFIVADHRLKKNEGNLILFFSTIRAITQHTQNRFYSHATLLSYRWVTLRGKAD